MSAINEVYKDVEKSLSSKQMENYVFTTLTKVISNAYTQIMSSDDGYCFKFTLPMTVVNKLYSDLNLDQTKISNAFMKDWGPKLTRMHQDSYYQILLLIIYYGIKNNRKYLTDNALMLILMKIWNGRKRTFFPKFCNPKIMNYVVNNMTTSRHNVSKYPNPVSLLKDYFVPTLTKKYENEIKNDIHKLKRLFEQCYSRIYELFVQNPRFNIDSGKNEAQGGLLPLYMKAREEGLYMQNTSTDEESQFSDFSSSSNREQINQHVVDAITMNPNPQYPNTIIQNINKMTKVSNRIIHNILKELHNHKHYDYLIEINSLILSKTNVVDKSDICNPNFKANIRKNIIKSKNNTDIKKLQSLINELLDKILPKVVGTNLNKYSNVHQLQIRNVIIYGLEYNLVKTMCK